MKRCCKQAEKRTKARALLLAGFVLWEGWKNNDLRLESLTQRYWQYGKHILDTNENARNDLATYIGCKLR